MALFKVWTNCRSKKALVPIQGQTQVLESLIQKASEKLKIEGHSVVLESDGTPVDEDEVVLLLKNETLILLEANQCWLPPAKETGSVSSATTVSISDIEDSNHEIILPEGYRDIQLADNIQIINVIDTNMEYKWSSFEIPWHKVPENMLKIFEEGKRPDKYIITQMIHIIINEMRQIKTSIPSKALKIVAHKMLEKYPAAFKDVDDDGVVLGDGSCSLFAKLHERATYLNRPHKRRNPGENDQTPLRLKKRRLNSMAGCSHWAPETEPDDDNKASSQEILNSMTEVNDEFLTLMEKTYPNQRKFLNNIESPPTVGDMMAQWPILFKKEALVWHFNKLTETNLEILPVTIEQKAERILRFGVNKKIIPDYGQDENRSLGEESLQVIAKHFKEDLSFLLYRFGGTDNLDTEVITQSLRVNAPCVVEKANNQGKEFFVYLEKTKVMKCDSFLESFMICFGMYFVMNLEYPKEISLFLEFIQRYYMKIHPDTGSKSKKLPLSKRRVINLMNQLRNT